MLVSISWNIAIISINWSILQTYNFDLLFRSLEKKKKKKLTFLKSRLIVLFVEGSRPRGLWFKTYTTLCQSMLQIQTVILQTGGITLQLYKWVLLGCSTMFCSTIQNWLCSTGRRSRIWEKKVLCQMKKLSIFLT
jgi:hypothetical protein